MALQRLMDDIEELIWDWQDEIAENKRPLDAIDKCQDYVDAAYHLLRDGENGILQGNSLKFNKKQKEHLMLILREIIKASDILNERE